MSETTTRLSEYQYEILRWLEVNPHYTSDVVKPGTPQEKHIISGPYGAITLSAQAWISVSEFIDRLGEPDKLFSPNAAGLAAMREKERRRQARRYPEPELTQ